MRLFVANLSVLFVLGGSSVALAADRGAPVEIVPISKSVKVLNAVRNFTHAKKLPWVQAVKLRSTNDGIGGAQGHDRYFVTAYKVGGGTLSFRSPLVAELSPKGTVNVFVDVKPNHRSAR